MNDETTDLAVRTPRKSRSYTDISSRSYGNRFSSHPSSDAASLISRFGHEVFCVLSGALECLSLTDNWENISGFPAEEDRGEGFKSRIAPDHIRRIARYLSRQDETASVRFQIKHSDGHWRWCEMHLVETEGRDPEKTQYKCLLRDVTGLVYTQGKLEKAKLEAELAIKSRSEFLANMSHELRTPLNAILGFAQMIETGTYGDIGHVKYQDYIGNIQESGTTLLSKINDLLEIANIDSGGFEIRESPTDVCSLIRHVIEFHSHRAFSEQISLHENLPSEPLLVNIDRIRMMQVVTNLVANAIKYNQPGGAVHIRCEQRKDGGVSIVIEDTGGGIPPTQLQNILSAFQQDNSFFARSRDCIGLGLALSKEIVKLHQGRIEIDSEPGKGTLLTIRLPRERTIKKPPAVKKVDSNVILSVN